MSETVTTILKVRAYNFTSGANRVHIYLANVPGTERGGWTYLIPDNPGAEIIVKLATEAKVHKLPVYVNCSYDDTTKDFMIKELGLE